MTEKKGIYLAGLLLLVTLAAAGAQSNDMIDQLLSQEVARFDTAAYLILSASGHIDESASPAEAVEKLISMKLALKGQKPDGALTVDRMSYILMKAVGVKGGIMYTLLPGPHYAYRELGAVEAVETSGGPARKVSGQEVIRSLRYALELKGGAK